MTKWSASRQVSGQADLFMRKYKTSGRETWRQTSKTGYRQWLIESKQMDSLHENYTKRKHGNILLQVMGMLGFQSFAIAGHDRGARIAYRLRLDRPAEITKLDVLDIFPVLDVSELINYDTASRMENWCFLSQPKAVPETLVGANPDFYLNYILDSWDCNQ